MNPRTCIVFAHGGNSWYLPFTTNQAKSISGGAQVIVLGDVWVGDGVITSKLERHCNSKGALEFRKNYVHLNTQSDRSLQYELFCFLRWFCLLAYMEEARVESALYLDSDVLLYSSIDEILAGRSRLGMKCGLSIPRQDFESHRWHVSGHASYWTPSSLAAFCDFATRSFTEERYLSLYREKWRWSQQTGHADGVSDMTALYLFWLESKDGIVNFAESDDGSVIDHNMNVSLNYEEDEYQMDGERKKVEFVDGTPMLVKKVTGERIRAHALHLQGGAKNFIPLYYRGGPFAGKAALDSYAVFRRMGQRGKRLVGR